MITIEQVTELYKQGNNELIFTFNTGSTKKLRLFESQLNRLCYYKERSRKYGYPVKEILNQIESVQTVKKSPESDKWVRSWQQVIDRLNKSGLWDDYKQEIILGLSMGYETIQKLNKICWEAWEHKDSENWEVDQVKNIAPQFIITRDNGSQFVAHNIIWAMKEPARIKKMNFGRDNDQFLSMIKYYFENKLPYRCFSKAAYDVSFEYLPDKQKAFYSEEFKGMGNGHYYLALDTTHAVFAEDD